jgi:hypothetical protein
MGTQDDPVIFNFPANSGYMPSYDLPENMTCDFFVYEFPLVSNLALAGNATPQVQIQNDADFEMRALAYYFNLANAAFTSSTRPIPNVTIMLTESGSGRNLFNNPVPLPNIAWNGEGAMRYLPWPKIFGRNANVQATIVNFDAAVVTGQLFLSMIGRKLFASGS